MRVTQNNFYNSFIYDQQNFKTELNTVNRQISSGVKIKYGYEDTSVFADTLRLDYEEHSLNQVVNVATDAQNFANNTDSVMFQFTDALTRFKTLLVQAANGTNDDNNFYAISNELESLKDNMINLGNTSINGRYLFSGSATDVKPIDANGNYFGNDKTEEAFVLDNTISGGVTVNDVVFHVSQEDIPFGGIGPSGMGHYHGVDGFKRFSHAKGIYKQSSIDAVVKLTRPPFTNFFDRLISSRIKK